MRRLDRLTFLFRTPTQPRQEMRQAAAEVKLATLEAKAVAARACGYFYLASQYAKEADQQREAMRGT